MSEEKDMSLVSHLEDLRRVIIISIASILITTLGIYFVFREELLKFLMLPMDRMDIPLVYIGVTEAFITQIKASFFAGLLVSLPIVLWQIWSFAVPALLPHERKPIKSIVPASFILFLVGVSFAYFMVFPVAVAFLTGISGDGLSPMISVSKYISFLISFSLPFGLVFQLPLIVLLLTKIGLVTPEMMVEKRKYAVLVIFVLAATLTPPDIISMILMAGPMVLLYEISIILAKIFVRKKAKAESENVDGKS